MLKEDVGIEGGAGGFVNEMGVFDDEAGGFAEGTGGEADETAPSGDAGFADKAGFVVEWGFGRAFDPVVFVAARFVLGGFKSSSL